MFAMFTVTSRPVPTGETVDGEPVYARQQASTAINAAHIVAIEFRPSSTGTDLLIKTMDGDTWSFPGTDENMAVAKEIIEPSRHAEHTDYSHFSRDGQPATELLLGVFEG